MENTPNTSVFAFSISAIRELLRERDSHLVKISREVNGLAHELAKIARVQHRTKFWLSDFLLHMIVTLYQINIDLFSLQKRKN
jgi:hypothetical protein